MDDNFIISSNKINNTYGLDGTIFHLSSLIIFVAISFCSICFVFFCSICAVFLNKIYAYDSVYGMTDLLNKLRNYIMKF